MREAKQVEIWCWWSVWSAMTSMVNATMTGEETHGEIKSVNGWKFDDNGNRLFMTMATEFWWRQITMMAMMMRMTIWCWWPIWLTMTRWRNRWEIKSKIDSPWSKAGILITMALTVNFCAWKFYDNEIFICIYQGNFYHQSWPHVNTWYVCEV